MANFNSKNMLSNVHTTKPLALDFFHRASDFFGQAVRRVLALSLAGTLALSTVGCGMAQGETASTANDGQKIGQVVDQASTNELATSSDAFDAGELFSDRDLESGYETAGATSIELKTTESVVSGSGATADGSTVTITAEGVYILSGEISDGRVVVDAGEEAKVQLVLDGASITSSTAAALYVKSADKVFVTTASKSTNTIAATGAATEEDEHTLDGTVFACDDLTINGSGTLTVTSEAGNGVVGKDEVTLTSGTLNVTAAGHAIQANDSVAVAGGNYKLEAGTDGIHVSNDEDAQLGYLYIADGTIEVTAKSDGIDAANDIQIDGGGFSITAGDDGIHSEAELIINGGTIDVSQSTEGLEGAQVTVNGGDTNVVASDDGVNATGDGTDTASEPVTMDMDAAGSEAAPQEGMQQAMGGRRMGQSQDMGGMGEGSMPEGGPRGGGMQDGGMGGMPGGGMGGGMMDSDATAVLTIRGGRLVVDSGGDGLDSNGSLVIEGGETYVNGPSNDGNGPLDCGVSSKVTGGTLIAIGSSGMAQGFGNDSTQGSILATANGSAGDAVEIMDEAGNVLASMTASKSYACVIATAPGMEAGGTYTLRCGSESTQVTA